MPFTLNRFEVKHGVVTYRDRSRDPPVDATLNRINLRAINLSNVKTHSYLPASLKAQVGTIGDKKIDLNMPMDFLQPISDV